VGLRLASNATSFFYFSYFLMLFLLFVSHKRVGLRFAIDTVIDSFARTVLPYYNIFVILIRVGLRFANNTITSAPTTVSFAFMIGLFCIYCRCLLQVSKKKGRSLLHLW
jgi:hypothetical protein